MDELLALLGGNWRQLLLYPGGLTLVAVFLVTHPLWVRTGVGVPTDAPRQTALLVQVVGISLCCAALPWPKTYWAYPIDLFTVVLLLEAPHWLRLHSDWHNGRATVRLAAAQEVVALLRVYPLLALAIALLAQGAGSLMLDVIKQSHGLLRWSGIGLWAMVLPPLLLLGPWHGMRKPELGRDLRRVGHIAVVAVLALPGGDGVTYSAAVVAALTSFGSLLLLDHAWQRHMRWWERWQPGFAFAALMFLLWTAARDLGARLH